MKKVIYENEKVDIIYNPDFNNISIIWKKLHDEDTYKFVYETAYKAMIEYKATSLFSDIRNQGVVSPANSKWLQEELIPKAVKDGLKKVAVLMDADVFKKFYMNNISKALKKEGSFTKYFDSEEEAIKWLME